MKANVRKPNNLPFSVEKAHKTQLMLARSIIFEDRLPSTPRLVAGVDVSYSGDMSIGTVTVLDYRSMELLEMRTATCRTKIPYVPTLLSFREIQPSTMAARKLEKSPDVFLVDGQGFSHPFRCGFAGHFGLVVQKPSIGIAKSRLIGEAKTIDEEGVTFLEDRGEVVGASVITRKGSKPVFISVGNMISLKTAIRIARECVRGNRVPEPIAKAHAIGNAQKRKTNIKTADNE